MKFLNSQERQWRYLRRHHLTDQLRHHRYQTPVFCHQPQRLQVRVSHFFDQLDLTDEISSHNWSSNSSTSHWYNPGTTATWHQCLATITPTTWFNARTNPGGKYTVSSARNCQSVGVTSRLVLFFLNAIETHHEFDKKLGTTVAAATSGAPQPGTSGAPQPGTTAAPIPASTFPPFVFSTSGPIIDGECKNIQI